MENRLQPVGAMYEWQAKSVVEVCVRLQGILQFQPKCLYASCQRLLLLPVPGTGVHNGSLQCLLVPKQISILLDRVERKRLIFHVATRL